MLKHMNIRLLTFFFLLIVLFACEREWLNPWDDKHTLAPDKWAPGDFKLEEVDSSITKKQLSWTYPATNPSIEKFVLLIRKKDQTDTVAISYVPGTENYTYVDIIIPNRDTIHYTVFAIAGNNKSDSMSLETVAYFPGPENLNVEQKDSMPLKQVLTWSYSYQDIDGFLLEKKIDDGDWQPFPEIDKDSRRSIDDNIFYSPTPEKMETNISYRISAIYRINDDTLRSSLHQVDTSKSIPSPLALTPRIEDKPTGNDQQSKKVSLSWKHTWNDESLYYTVQRKRGEYASSDDSGDWVQIKDEFNSMTYEDEDIDFDKHTYTYRVYAHVGDFKSDSSETQQLSRPIVKTGQVVEFTTTSATISVGADFLHHGNLDTKWELQWRAGVDADGQFFGIVPCNSADVCTLEGLKHGRKYQIRAIATNAAGTSYGEIKSFHTKFDASLIPRVEVLEIQKDKARVKYTYSLQEELPAIRHGISWGPVPDPTNNQPGVAILYLDQGEEAGLQGEAELVIDDKTHYVRVFVLNHDTYYYGEVISLSFQKTAPGTNNISDK